MKQDAIAQLFSHAVNEYGNRSQGMEKV